MPDERIDELIAEFLEAEAAGRSPDRAALLARHADLADELRSFFADHDRMRAMAEPLHPPSQADTPTLGLEAPLSPGATVRYFGDYEILAEIARGGMGVVYKARQVSLNRVVALKMILAGQLASPADVQRFHAEAEAAANLDHPNIVPIYEVGDHEGQHYFSMKLIEGGSLSSFSREPLASASNQRRAAHLLATVARAVHHAHQRGVIHRDLKPANILLDEKGEPHVSDFGLARRVEGGANPTRTGAIVGTPSYMAPEQARAEKSLSTAVDVYSLGAILYELLTDRPPFKAETPLDTVLQLLEREPERPSKLQPGIDRDLETVCLKCLEKDHERRYGSAEALADDLARFLRHEPIHARPIPAPARLWRWCRRNPWIAATSAASVVALATTTVLAVVTAQNARTTAENADATARSDRERLWQSTVDQARAERRAGNRSRSLELLAEAARTKRTEELRKDAIETITSPEVRLLGEYADPHMNSQTSSDGKMFTVDARNDLSEKDPNAKTIEVRDMTSNNVLFRRSGIYSRAFRPAFAHLVFTTNEDKRVHLWDIQTQKLLATFPEKGEIAHTQFVFSPDGNLLLLDTTDGKVVWNLATGGVESAPSGDGRMWFVSGQELIQEALQRYRRWNVLTGKETGATPEGWIPVGISGDGQKAVLRGRLPGEERQTTVLWEMSTSTLSKLLPPEAGIPPNVLLSHDGRRLAFVTPDDHTAIQVWDTITRQLISRISARGLDLSFAYDVDHLSLSPDGGFVGKFVLQGEEGGYHIWETESTREIKRMPHQVFRGWYGRDGTRFSTEGASITGKTLPEGGTFTQTIVVNNRKLTLPMGICHEWQMSFPTPAYSLLNGIKVIYFRPDGKQLIVNDTLWDVVSDQERSVLQRSALVAPGSSLVFGGADQVWALKIPTEKQWEKKESIRLRQLGSAKPEIALAIPSYPELEKRLSEAVNKQGKRSGVRLTPETSEVLAVSPDVKHMLIQFAIKAEEEPERPLPNEGAIMTGYAVVYTVELWDTSRRDRLAIWAERKKFDGACFSPDGKRAALADVNGLSVWDVATSKVERELSREPVQLIAFSSDGERVLAVSRGDKVRLFDVNSGEEAGSWPAEKKAWLSAAFNSSDQLAASGSEDGLIRLWDVASGRELACWQAHEFRITALSFSPDGQTLVSGSSDGGLKLWNLPYIRKGLASLGLDW
jgi:serine/threonine protein kinase/WD40 repeat protein